MNGFTELIDGYHRFRNKDYPRQRDDWKARAQGQSPPVMIISCVDSRVDPAQLFGFAPGEAFIHRNVANLVPAPDQEGHDGVLSAIQFGVEGLGVSHILVMGHSGCGGIAACLAGQTPYESVDRWVAIAEKARQSVEEDDGIADKQRGLEEEAVRQSLRNLAAYPFIAERLERGALQLHGAHFDIASARLSLLDAETGNFNPE